MLPGVGAFADCRAGLYAVPGMVEVLQREVIERGKPFLGICVGMQLMATRGVEYGVHAGPRLDRGRRGADRARHGPPQDPAHGLERAASSSSRIRCWPASRRTTTPISCTPSSSASRPETLLAITDYGGPITAIVGRDNLAGTQFHPEKSQATGLRLIANFLRWKP